jgi:hypothetical protein
MVIALLDSGQLYVADLDGSADIGRQQSEDEPQPSHKRVAIAWSMLTTRSGGMAGSVLPGPLRSPSAQSACR